VGVPGADQLAMLLAFDIPRVPVASNEDPAHHGAKSCMDKARNSVAVFLKRMFYTLTGE
jgi:hypothetical protein